MPNLVQKYIDREIFSDVLRHLEQPEITLITGSRQVGKTVLLEQMKEHLITQQGASASAIFNYNLDLIQDWQALQNQQDFIEFLKSRSQKQKIYVLIDEAQKVEEAARFFKGVYDSRLNAKLILTGSSSLELKAKFKETLAGRKRVFQVTPFTFLEFLRTKDCFLSETLKNKERIVKLDEEKIIKFFKEYLIYGGYPRCVLAESPDEKQQILKEIFSSYVERDVVGWLEIKNKAAFTRLIKLLAAQIGQLVNINELALHCAIDRGTVERYLMALEETFIIKRIEPYFRNPRQEIIKRGKVYFMDVGMRNTVLENFETMNERLDKGQVLENAVCTELVYRAQKTGGKVRFWRTKQKTEVDFVVERGGYLLPIEVKYSVKNRRVSSGLKNFMSKFHVPSGTVVTLEKDAREKQIGAASIFFAYPYELQG